MNLTAEPLRAEPCRGPSRGADRNDRSAENRVNSPERQAAFGQHGHLVRFDWGPMGAQAMEADLAVVVDVLSFSTSVCVAVERGMSVFPYRWTRAGAEAFARDHDAVLAVGRLESTLQDSPTAPSLSPAALLTGPTVPRLSQTCLALTERVHDHHDPG